MGRRGGENSRDQKAACDCRCAHDVTASAPQEREGRGRGVKEGYRAAHAYRFHPTAVIYRVRVDLHTAQIHHPPFISIHSFRNFLTCEGQRRKKIFGKREHSNRCKYAGCGVDVPRRQTTGGEDVPSAATSLTGAKGCMESSAVTPQRVLL